MIDDSCILTIGDFSSLKSLQEQWTVSDHELAPALRRKLDTAKVVFQADFPRDVASLGSEIAYTIDDGEVRNHILTSLTGLDNRSLPIGLPLGLALLGQREGRELDVDVEPGRSRRVKLHRVVGQPETNWPGRYGRDATTSQTPSSTLVQFSTGKRRQGYGKHIDDDDPGPAAA